jgi:hypothetical protein
VAVEDSTRELLYPEYVRLHALVSELTRSSFEDFRLLSVVGSAASFLLSTLGAASKDKHVQEFFHLHTDGVPLPTVLLFGFLTMFGLVAIIAFRDLMKQGLIDGLLQSMAPYEEALQARGAAPGTFSLVKRTYQLLNGPQRWRVLAFQTVFSASVLGLPFATLWLFAGDTHAWTYLAIAGGLTVLFVLLASRLHRRP